MKEQYDNLKIEFIKYKIANDISRFIEDVRLEESNEVLGSKITSAIQGNILYIDWLNYLIYLILVLLILFSQGT